MKIIIFYSFLFLLSTVTFSQIKVSGKLTTNAGQPIPFANVLLLSLSDTSLIKGTVSDEMGKYELNQLQTGKYFLKYSAIGSNLYFSNIRVRNSEYQGTWNASYG